MSGADLGRLVRDFGLALEGEPYALIPNFEAEPPPDSVQLVYHPPTPAPGAGAAAAPGAGPIPGVAGAGGMPGVAPGQASGELPANFRCNLCPDRMYPVRRFEREGRRPILVLYHSGSYGRGPARLDRSRETIFGSPEEDDLFSRMLGAVDLSPDDLFFQEYPACHFNAVRSTPDDWQTRGEHCLSHVRDTVLRHKIELLILTGPAAVILLGEERARQLSADCGQAQIPAGDRELPALVMRSPAALIALENKRKRLQSRGEAEAAKQAVEEEKRVKKQVVAALKAAVPG